MLCYLGQKRLEITVCQHFTWLDLTPNVKITIDKYHLFKIHKLVLGKYGHLAPKNIDHEYLWHTLCIDLIGPHTVEDAIGIDYSLLAITMTDSSTGWFEVAEIKNKSAEYTGQILDHVWLSHYPRPV